MGKANEMLSVYKNSYEMTPDSARNKKSCSCPSICTKVRQGGTGRRGRRREM